jgi:biofilm PGA synthesis N-glycosyltransferase PgaC
MASEPVLSRLELAKSIGFALDGRGGVRSQEFESQMTREPYVLVTPARNEAAFLPGVLNSVLAQAVRPTKWVIVSDGSTDGTDELMAAAAKGHDFIHLIRAESGRERSFGSKARAFQQGLEALRVVGFGFIGNLDADVTFEPQYYERMLAEMADNPRLGIASGACWDKTLTGFKCTTISHNHAVGAVQFFRRECFEASGGYRPVSVGGVDSLAILTARMKGWQTRVFPDLPVYHHKPVDSANARSRVRVCYRAGLTEYHIGSHPLFAVAKALRRWREAPALVSILIRLAGYGRLWLSGAKRDAPDDLVAYLKQEQMALLRDALLGRRIA